MKHYFTQYRYYLRTKRTYIYFIIPIVISILSALYFSHVYEPRLNEAHKVLPLKNVEFNYSSMKIIKKQYSSINYNTSGPIFDYFYLSCGPDYGIYDFNPTSNCLVLRYDKKPGSVQFRIPKDLLRQEGSILSLILYPQISNVEVGLFTHKSIPFQIISEDDQYVILRVDVPINEPVIYVNFAERCSFMCSSIGLPKSTWYAVGIFFVTLILYYVLVWVFKNRIARKAKTRSL